MKRFLLILLAGLSLLYPCTSGSEVVDKILAIVNDDIITMSDVEKYVRVEKQGKFTSADDYFRDAGLKDKLDAFIENTLIQQQARRLKIEISDLEVQMVVDSIKKQNLITEEDLREQLRKANSSYKSFFEGIRSNLVRSKVLARTISPDVLLSEARLKEHYQANPDEFRAEEYRLQQVFISNRTQDAARRAQAAYNALQQGQPFEQLAKEYSDDPSGKQGGDIGYVKKEDLVPELRQAISLLISGTYSHPVLTPYGYHIMKVIDVRKSAALPFEAVKDSIQEKIVQKESEKRYKEYITKLRASSYIEVKI
jgi:peptidyl-prolyl cis-trans isomerase SurA